MDLLKTGFKRGEIIIDKRRNRITKTAVSVFKVESVSPYVVVCEHGKNICYDKKKDAIDAAACPHWCELCGGDRPKIF